MDPPIHALKFSEDLIHEILLRHRVIKDREQWGFMRNLDMFQKQRCPLPVHQAVMGLMDYRKDRIQASFDNLCGIKVFNISDFRFELSLTAIMYFKEGYDHFKFLNYCALLGGLSVLYAKAGHREIPSGCCQLLAYLLNFWMYSMVFNPNSDYFELAVVAQRVRRNLKAIWEKEEEVKDAQKGPEKGEESLKRREKGDGIKEDQKQTEKQKAVESAKADAHKVLDKAEGGKNTPKKKGSERLPETPQKVEFVPEKMPENDGTPETPKYKRPQKARRGGKR